MHKKLASSKGKRNPSGFLLNTPDRKGTSLAIPLGISAFGKTRVARKADWCSYFVIGKRLDQALNKRSE